MKKVVRRFDIECGYVDTPFGVAKHVIGTDEEEIWIDDKTQKTRKKPKATKNIAIFSGNILEVKTYSEPVFYNFETKATGRKKFNGTKRTDNLNKSKVNLRRLINANIDLENFNNNKFVTLTFASAEKSFDIDYCKDEFKKFVKRLKYHTGINLKYVYVVEIQKSREQEYGDKVWHFHAIFFNLPYIDNTRLAEIWGNGFIKINVIDNVDNVGAYVVKYMDKDFSEVGELKNLYGRSRGNLNAPIVIKEEEVVQAIIENIEDKKVYDDEQQLSVDKPHTFSEKYLRRSDLEMAFNNNLEFYKSYESYTNSEYYSTIRYRQYNFLRKDNLIL